MQENTSHSCVKISKYLLWQRIFILFWFQSIKYCSSWHCYNTVVCQLPLSGPSGEFVEHRILTKYSCWPWALYWQLTQELLSSYLAPCNNCYKPYPKHYYPLSTTTFSTKILQPWLQVQYHLQHWVAFGQYYDHNFSNWVKYITAWILTVFRNFLKSSFFLLCVKLAQHLNIHMRKCLITPLLQFSRVEQTQLSSTVIMTKIIFLHSQPTLSSHL